MLKKPGIRKLFKIFKFPSHFHVTLTAGIITLQFNIMRYFNVTHYYNCSLKLHSFALISGIIITQKNLSISPKSDSRC